ncbi:MAG: CotH kinase family protein [Flavobacteriales bacterium]|nr:CotH kinase family protein [Flavobacteriales bacterium]
MAKKLRTRKRWIIALVVLTLLAIGGGVADRMLKHRNHPGLSTFMGQLVRNYPASFAVEPLVLELQVDESELAQLQRVVDEARERGVILPEGNEAVNATLTGPNGTFKAKVRIKGKLTDHVKGDKWSFRVVAKKDEGFLGMRRFSLQHPGTRNYLTDWLFHQMMAGEDVIALRYGFIRLHFNGEDLGVYAYEEHFGPELLEHNGRTKGPIFRFDPALFWQHRLNMMQKVRYEEAFAAYQAAAVDAFGSSDLERDSSFRTQFAEAVALIDAFRRGERSASEVFDVDRVARRHAMLDLIGGHHSMDWSDVKFYYDPVLQRVEPVSYESFSGLPLQRLAGSGKWTGHRRSAQDLHEAYFNDEGLFKAYVHHLERYADKAFLDSVFTALAPALDSASATIYREFPFKELDRGLYYRNQQVIRRLLDVPKPFHAFQGEGGADRLTITVLPIEHLPMEVHGLVLEDGTVLPPDSLRIIPVRQSGNVGAPVQITFTAPPGKVLPAQGKARVLAGVLGASARKEVEVFAQPYLSEVPSGAGTVPPVLPSADAHFLVDEAARTITLAPGAWTMSSDVSLPAGYQVLARAPLTVTLAPGVRFISRSPVQIEGLSEAPVQFTGGAGAGFHVIGAQARSTWQHVQFNTLPVVVQEAQVKMDHVKMDVDGGSVAFTAVRSQVDGAHVHIVGGMMRGGQVLLKDCELLAQKGAALRCGTYASGTVERGKLTGAKRAVQVWEGATLELNAVQITAQERGVDVDEVKGRYGPSKVTVKGGVRQAPAPVWNGSGNTVSVDGVAVEATAKP